MHGRRSPSIPTLLALAALTAPVAASQEASLTSLVVTPHGAVEGVVAGTILENFPNGWHVNTIGLEDPGAGTLIYAHETVAPDPNTIWFVDDTAPHATQGSLDLSALNPGFPVTLNDRDGAAFDPATGTYFLPDYQGDLVARDDNVVEISAAGTILNAWELDGPGNDSSDGSNINIVIDIAIVSGAPNRYFMTSAGDNVLREVSFTRAGLWAPASWSTVTTCPVPGLGFLTGVDYDSASGLLFVSDFASEQIVAMDLSCNVVETFLCDGPGTFHTGAAVVPGANPVQVWLTDFNSNSTSRCELPGLGEPIPSVLEVPALSRFGFAALVAALAAIAFVALRRRARA